MGTETNENCGLEDRNSSLNQGNETEVPKKDADDNNNESEVNPPSQPAEEHLITEAEDLQNKDSSTNLSSYEDTDQGAEEIDSVNLPRIFQNILPQKAKKP